MGTIWDVLERYAGLWVAVDREWKVVATGPELEELKSRASTARTFVFASGDRTSRG